MMQSDFLDLKNRFNEYVNSYCDGDGQLHPMLQLKLDHSLRVAYEAREIAVELGWSEPEILMAEIIGLLHDVGRFSQYQEFRTYFDPKSVNHGCRGFQVLSTSDWLSRLSSEESHLIMESV
ncbi:MAG: HD protein, partial [uncultured bacterium]